MNVGIIAANLPTLKPLFANFFGNIRTFTKGRSTGSRSGHGLSAPFKSNGYFRQDDRSTNHASSCEQNSYTMRDINTLTGPNKKESYDDILILGKENYDVSVEYSGRQSAAGASDDIASAHDRLSIPRSQCLSQTLPILKTTEVRVSKNYEQL